MRFGRYGEGLTNWEIFTKGKQSAVRRPKFQRTIADWIHQPFQFADPNRGRWGKNRPRKPIIWTKHKHEYATNSGTKYLLSYFVLSVGAVKNAFILFYLSLFTLIEFIYFAVEADEWGWTYPSAHRPSLEPLHNRFLPIAWPVKKHCYVWLRRDRFRGP